MKMAVIIASAILVTLAIGDIATGQKSSAEIQRHQREAKMRHERRAAQMRADHKRRTAEMKREHDQRVRKMQAEFRAKNPSRSTYSTRQAPPPPFNAAAAPPPADCLNWYLAAARSATSMDQILKYLPLHEQKSLRSAQNSYDPQEAARQREWFLKKNPKLKNSSLGHLTNPPYVNGLAKHKRLADKIREVLSVRIEGNKAVVRVSTNASAVVNGVRYKYGTAEIEMLGEQGFWKFDTYNDSDVVYLRPPKPKP